MSDPREFHFTCVVVERSTDNGQLDVLILKAKHNWAETNGLPSAG
jgi:hypothetical protein